MLPKLLMKELQQSQVQVEETNALANKLLTLYANDDTHKVTQINNSMNMTCAHINKRYTCSLRSRYTLVPLLLSAHSV